MRIILILAVMLVIITSCGKKGDPKYKGSINNFVTLL